MNAKTEAAVIEHGAQLLAVFPHAEERHPVKLCRKLRKLEREGDALGLRLCNGPEYAPGQADEIEADILRRVNSLLGNTGGPVPVFINTDPRGYALKIDDAWTREHAPRMHRDWGGYGIIAPDPTETR